MNNVIRPMMRPVSPKEAKRRRRARRVGMFFDTLANTLAVLSAVIIMWFLISWVDFCAHNLAIDFSPLDDLWLGGANLVYLICSALI